MFTSELIVGTGSNAKSLDLQTEIPISVNLTIADIREPEKRNGSYTKTIKLKGTKTNNIFFEHTYDVNIATVSWNANLKTPAVVLQGGSVVFEGYLRLLQVNVTLVNGKNNIEYEVSLFGDNNSLFASIGDLKLQDLDLSEFDHVYSRENIVKSWYTFIKQNGVDVAFSLGNGYVYPLIDYGYNNFLTNSFPVETWRPAFYEKTYLDKIFSDAGKTYTSNFFNTQFFKKQIIPHNGDKFPMSAANLAVREFYAGDTGAASDQNRSLTYSGFTNVGWWHGVYSSTIGANTLDCKWNDDSTNPFTDPGLQYDPSTGVITINSTGIYNISGVINWETKVNPPAGTVTIVSPSITPTTYYLLKSTDGGATYSIAGSYFYNHSGIIYSTSYTSINYTLNAGPSTYYAGEKYKIAVRLFINSTTSGIVFKDGGGNNINSGTTSLDSRLRSSATLSLKLSTPNYSPGQTLSVNDAIPKDIKQKDFLTSLFKKYNLYVDIDADNPDNYLIETRDDFYAAGSTKDWSEKLAWDKPMNIKPMSELDWKTIIYRYKADTDYYNTQYFDRQQEPYGSYKKVITNDFVSKDVKNELIFSPTPVVDNPNNSLIIPKIFAYDGTVVKPTKHNIRSLMYNGVVNMSSGTWDFPSPVSDIFGGTIVTSAVYPEAAMVGKGTFSIPVTSPGTASPLAPTESIEFGIPNEVFYTLGTTYTTNNLFNRFYSRQINEITDRDAKIVIAWVKLEPHDISQFDFRDTIYLHDAYYYVNKIIDYNPLEDELTKVEFIKIKRYDAFVATTPAVAIAETGLGNTGIGANRFGTDPNTTTTEGAGNNIMVGTNISSRSTGSLLNGRNIMVDTSAERISVVNCSDVSVFSGVSGFTGLNCSGIYIGGSCHDISLTNCKNITIDDFVYDFVGIGLSNQTITSANSGTGKVGILTTFEGTGTTL